MNHSPTEILCTAALAVLIALALGHRMLLWLDLRLSCVEHLVFAWLNGAMLLSYAVFALCCLGIANRATFALIGVAAAATLWRTRWPLAEIGARPAWPFLLLGAGFGAWYFVHACAPETSPDAITYHFGLIQKYWRAGGFIDPTTNIYASLTQGCDLLFLYVFPWGGFSAGRLMHFLFLNSLAALIFCYGVRLRMANAGACAALLVYVTPVVGVTGVSAYVDLAGAAYTFGAFFALQQALDTESERWVMLAGALAGFSFAVKYPGGTIVLLGLLWLVWRRQWYWAALFAGVAGIVMLPWLLKNYWQVGNPVAPVMTAWFPNPGYDAMEERFLGEFLRTYGLTFRQIARQWFVDGNQLGGLIGPAWIVIVPLSLLSWRDPAQWRLRAAAMVTLAVLPANVATRFLIPALPFLALAFCRGAGVPAAVVVLAAHAFLSLPAPLRWYAGPGVWALEKVPIAEALRWRTEESCYAERCPGYAGVRMLDQHVPADKSVFTFTYHPEAFTSRNLVVSFLGAKNLHMRDVLQMPLLPDERPRTLLEVRFPARELGRLRIVTEEDLGPRRWSIQAVFPAAAAARASDISWDTRYLFDGSMLTRWRSRDQLRAGAWLEFDYPPGTHGDAIRLVGPRGQESIDLRLEHWNVASQRWEPQGKFLYPGELPDLPDARREATRAVRRMGIDYLLTSEGDFGYEDYETRQRDWGLRPVARSGGFRLYALE